MGNYSYTRPIHPNGTSISLVDVDANADQLPKLVETQFPDKAFTVAADGTNITFKFIDTLTSAEQTTLSGIVSSFSAPDPV